MYCMDFMFANELASDYNLMLCRFDGSGGNIESVRNGADIEFTTVKTPRGLKWNKVDSSYSEFLTTTFQLMKNTCNDSEDVYFSVDEQRKINRWLNRPDNYYEFRPIQEGYSNIFFEAQIMVNKMVFGDDVIGFEITVNTNRPFALMDQVLYEFEDNEFEINDVSDKIGYIYPVVKIECKEDGNLTIHNSTINEDTIINNCVQGEVITMDNENRILSSSVRGILVINDFNFQWLRIANTYDNRINSYNVDLNCKVTIEYNPIILIGM